MVRRIVDANMGQAIRRETVLKGFDPRQFILFAFGGAGPTHCCGYARFAEMDKIVVFPFAPTFCAFGSSTMDVVHVYERSRHLHVLHPLDRGLPGRLRHLQRDRAAVARGRAERLRRRGLRP